VSGERRQVGDDWDSIREVRIHDVKANKRFELKRQPLETVISEIRVAGPPDAAATFLSETTLRTGEDVALLAVWSERDQALTSAPYRTGPMQIIATGGLDDAVRALRKGAALKAVKALLALAAGIGVIVVLITRRHRQFHRSRSAAHPRSAVKL
jgi:hypothetical protein